MEFFQQHFNLWICVWWRFEDSIEYFLGVRGERLKSKDMLQGSLQERGVERLFEFFFVFVDNGSLNLGFGSQVNPIVLSILNCDYCGASCRQLPP
jgi:hypothetical protein